MDKKVLNIIILIVIIAIVIFAYMQWTGKKVGEEINAPASQFDSVIDNPIEAMPETNPFDTNVNPMEGYKNPFE